MNTMNKIFPLFNTAKQIIAPLILPRSTYTSLSASSAVVPSNINSAWSFTQIRTKIRNYFPRADENKRLKKHGWRVRLSTPNGRKVLMRRILKGCHVLAH